MRDRPITHRADPSIECSSPALLAVVWDNFIGPPLPTGSPSGCEKLMSNHLRCVESDHIYLTWRYRDC
jgi:hypothetical protein